MSTRWHNEFGAANQYEIPTPAKSSGWHNALAISHPDEIRSGASSSGWLRFHMTLCCPDYMLQLSIIHLDEILTIAKSSGWLRDQIISLLQMTRPNRKSSGWHPAVSIRRPDELRPWANSSRWVSNYIMTYCSVHKSSGGDAANSEVIRVT